MDNLDVDAVFKLKIEGLKQELVKRGLSKSGTKTDLQARLLEYLTSSMKHDVLGSVGLDSVTDDPDEAGDDEELNKQLEKSLDEMETPVLKDSHKEFDKELEELVSQSLDGKVKSALMEQKGPEKVSINRKQMKVARSQDSIAATPAKKVALTTPTDDEKKTSRIKRFGVAANSDDKKKLRLDRFAGGSSIIATPGAKTVTSSTGESADKLKSRTERFGVEKSAVTGLSDKEKLAKRNERFSEDKLKKRQQRFGVVQPTSLLSSDMEARRQARVSKFGV